MKSVKEAIEYQIEIKKSKFICNLIPCNQEEDIPLYIDEIKERYPDASHHCIAYIVGKAIRANDDGEPSGTAGIPMLDVLKKQELENIIAVVTRYFGGIKLGAGGLSRAYRQSVADAIKEANIVEKELVPLYEIEIDYSFSKKMDHLIKIHQIPCINKTYDTKVNYSCFIKDDKFFDLLQEYTNNQYFKKLIKNDYITVI